jgi:transcription antitermination factor NusG
MDWIILTCSNAKTLDLARSLTEAGFDAWSPVETIKLQPRHGKKREDIVRPLMPSFVFAKAMHLAELLALSHSPTLNYRIWDSALKRMVTRGHPYFKLFRPFGEIRMVSDSELDHLRKLEKRRRPKGKAPVFAKGDVVKITEGGFAGLSGIVEETRGGYTTVTISDWAIPVQVSTWLLHPGEAGLKIAA